MDELVDSITLGDCRELLHRIPSESVHLCLSDIPYGISFDNWDILHQNTNNALLGQSPAQIGHSAFKRRGKPIQGWNKADRNIPSDYEKWCRQWAKPLFPAMKKGASLFFFGARRTIHRAIVALEDEGFVLRDVLAWKKKSAHHRSQKLATVLAKRGEHKLAKQWQGWRLGNLAPIYEPIAWMFKPYDRTVTDNVLLHGIGAMNIGACQLNGSSPTNLLDIGFRPGESRWHEAQKPLDLAKYLIRLTTVEGMLVLDPFIGSGTTAVACRRMNRRFIGFEANENYHQAAMERLGKIHSGG
ncbi:MAG TPA: site-specific DNA-methyltransferase [candidate division Zixibacteria bacterium]|nr:site-specific DNA-methyltransferase [candidate division Zixibacteria bacterium]